MTNDLKTALCQFYGSEQFYRHPLGGMIYTEGVQYLAEHGGAYWLLDFIAIHQKDDSIYWYKFQVWQLTVNDNASAKLRVEDGDKRHVKTYEIGFTDFPLKSIELWHIDGTLLLPSEY